MPVPERVRAVLLPFVPSVIASPNAAGEVLPLMVSVFVPDPVALLVMLPLPVPEVSEAMVRLCPLRSRMPPLLELAAIVTLVPEGSALSTPSLMVAPLAALKTVAP